MSVQRMVLLSDALSARIFDVETVAVLAIPVADMREAWISKAHDVPVLWEKPQEYVAHLYRRVLIADHPDDPTRTL